MGWFPTWDQALLSRYLLHWTDHEAELGEENFACSRDRFPYGDCWQATNFAAQLGFPWPFDQAMEGEGITIPPPLPTLGKILEQGIPPMSQEAVELLERSPLLRLPHTLTPEYQLALLADPRVAELGLKEKNPSGGRHRAWKDLNRLMELDPANRTIYQNEIQRWKSVERCWSTHQNQNFSDWARQVEERKRQEKEREERRLQIILEKWRKKTQG